MWDRTARRIEADNLDDLAGHRRLQSPEGQQFLQLLRDQYHSERTDPLMPWLAREFRKGRMRWHQPQWIYPDDGPGPEIQYNSDPGDADATALGVDPSVVAPIKWKSLRPDKFNHWADWYHQPDRRKVPIEQLKAHDFPGEIEAYERAKARRMQDEEVEEGRHHGEVVHSWPDGWSLRKLPAGKALDFEAWNMRGDADSAHPHGAPICVNWPEYQSRVGHGDTLIYSLRDPQGNPHVTTEIEPRERGPKRLTPEGVERGLAEHPGIAGWPERHKQNLRDYLQSINYDPESARRRPDPDDLWSPAWEIADSYGIPDTQPHKGQVVQIQGKGNSVPKPEYQARMKDWFSTFPEGERPDWELEAQESFDDPSALHDYYQDPGEFWRWNAPDGGQGGYGPHGDYGLVSEQQKLVPAIDYDRYLSNILGTRGRDQSFYHGDADVLHKAAVERGEVPELAKAVENFGQEQQQFFDDWLNNNYEIAPRFPAEEDEDSPAMKAYYEELAEWEHDHPGLQATQRLYENLKPHYNQATNKYENFHGSYGQFAPQQQATFSKVTETKPFRFLWAFSGQSGKVHLHEESEHHPAEEPTHDSIAADLGEVGLHHGYAYVIPGGWRVLDYHHEPVADPFVLRHVVEALRKRLTEPHRTMTASWLGDDPSEPTLFWRPDRPPGPNDNPHSHEVHIKNFSGDLSIGNDPAQGVVYYDNQGDSHFPKLGPDGALTGFYNGVRPPRWAQPHIRRALDVVAQHAEAHRDLSLQMKMLDQAEQNRRDDEQAQRGIDGLDDPEQGGWHRLD